jgi:hypothetical protein
LTTVQGLPKKFDQKKILKVIKKAFACNGTIVSDTEMGEVIQLQGDQRKDVQEFLCDKKGGLGLDAKTIKVRFCLFFACFPPSFPSPFFDQHADVLALLYRSTVSKRLNTAPCTLVGYERPAGGSYDMLCPRSNRFKKAPIATTLHGFFSTTLTTIFSFRHELLIGAGTTGVAQDGHAVFSLCLDS